MAVAAYGGFALGVLARDAVPSLAFLLTPKPESTCEAVDVFDCLFENLGPGLRAMFTWGLYVVAISAACLLAGALLVGASVAQLRQSGRDRTRAPAFAYGVLTTGVTLLTLTLWPIVTYLVVSSAIG